MNYLGANRNWPFQFHSIAKEIMEGLIECSREIFSNLRNEQQWKNCENFVKKCSCQYPPVPSLCCSHRLCSLILQNKHIWKSKGIKLSNILMNLIIYILQEPLSYHLFQSHTYYDYLQAGKKIREICSRVHKNTEETFRILIALRGNSQLMKMLVNMDLLPSLKTESAIVISDHHNNLRDFISLHRKEPIHPNVQSYISWHSALFQIEDEILKSTGSLFCQLSLKNYLGSFERICLATIAILTIQLKLQNEHNKAKEYIYCLRMYFITTRDPLLTINEVRTMLYACFYHLDKLHLLESYFGEFVKLMPECPVTLEPRNLTDLARFQIRQNLRKCNLPFFVAVDKLTIPPPLKSFVLGDVIEMSRNSGHVSQEQVITLSELEEMQEERQQF